MGPLDDEIQERDAFDPSMIGRPIHAIWEPYDLDEADRIEIMGILEYVSVRGGVMAVGVKTGVETEYNGWEDVDIHLYNLTVRVFV